MMSEETESRKPRTPNFDRVIDAIERGDYDEKVIELHRALAKRRGVLQDRVLEQVRQVFGPDADITVSTESRDQDAVNYEENNPFVKKAERIETAAERGKRVMQNANDGKTRPAPPLPVTSSTADQIDENRITKDALENVKSDAGLPVSEVEQRMMQGERVLDIEHRGAIVSGLSARDIGD